MIFLIILGIILLVVGALLFAPVNINILFEDKFSIKVIFFGITVFKTSRKENVKKDENKSETKTDDKKTVNKAKSIFTKLKEKHGFSIAVKKVFAFFMECIPHIKVFLRHIKINKIRLNVVVASSDAASTAIEYGAVCSAVYPTLALIDTIPNVDFKKINVKSDFDSNEGKFDFSLNVKLKIVFALILAFKIYKNYKNFIIRIEDDERK